VLYVAIAVWILAVLAGSCVLLRSVIGVSRRLTRLDELVTSATALIEQAREVSVRATRVRAQSERLRALAQPVL
jgi:hypothetical protein